jgi:CHAT domain-containing protein/lipopolysaccharide biosynthesis regulator YciM
MRERLAPLPPRLQSRDRAWCPPIPYSPRTLALYLRYMESRRIRKILCVLALGALTVVSMARAAEGDLERARQLGAAAAAARSEGDYQKAATLAREAVALFRQLGDAGGEAAGQIFLGMIEVAAGDLRAAVDALRAGLPVARMAETTEEQRWLVETLYILSQAEFKLGRYQQAAERLEEAAALCQRNQELGDLLDVVRDDLASVYVTQGRKTEALPLLQAALQRAEASGRPEKLATALTGLAIAESGDFDTALRQFHRAETLVQGKPDLLAMVRHSMAVAYAGQGRYEESLALLKQVEEHCRKNPDDHLLASTLNGYLTIYTAQSRWDDAQRKGDEALLILRRIGHDADRAVVLSNLATLDFFRGDYDRALSRLEEALALHRGSGNGEGEAVALLLSGHVYSELGRVEEAFTRYERGREKAHTAGVIAVEADALQEMGQLFIAQGRVESALARLDEALALAQGAGLRPLEIQIQLARVVTVATMGRFEEALGDAQKVLTLSRQLGDRNSEAEANLLIGLTFTLQGHNQKALGSLNLALGIQRELGSFHRSVTLGALGLIYEKLGQPDAAIAAYKEDAETSESTFEGLRVDDLLAGLAGHTTDSFSRWASLLAAKGDAAQAFAVAERARARAFLRRIGNSPPDLHKSPHPELLREEVRLRARIQGLNLQLREEQKKALSAQTSGARTSVSREIDKARRDYESLLIQLKQLSPEYASLVHPSPLTLPEAQKLLDGDTTLVEYFWVEDGALAWIIDSESSHLVRLAVLREETARRIELFRHRIAGREPIEEDATHLYQALFAPLAPHIRHHRVTIVPHGPLNALPFAALSPDRGKTFLVERYALTLLPNASVLPFLQSKRSPDEGRLLALGNPDGSLPDAAIEARAVARLYGEKPLLGREATKKALRQALRPIDHLHFATHAVFDPARPLFSRIELAASDGDDGALEAHEIFGLDLRGTNLVVLSGCDTGIGVPTEGDELESLSRAFLYAGASAVMATLWPIDDAGSRELIVRFYRLLRSATGTPEALQEAQIEALHRNGRRAPLFWAGFTLTGDAGAAAPSPPSPHSRGVRRQSGRSKKR